jgi:uncharacterized protein (TIGR02611 family)
MHSFGTLVRFIWRSTKRALVMVVGVALLAGGVVMLVTPGPGIVLVVAGLAVLATEFVWAERMLDKAKAHAATATAKLPGGTQVRAFTDRVLHPHRRATEPPDPVALAEAASSEPGSRA